ncbi:cytochrome c oxidase subunit III [Sphingobium chlorophenolicum L-1]|uniref:Cytochrome c oxidase subunit III n=1 Tax=Sphingobium chlorophenolicum L-1 TaxID=690566 RepID=F6F3K5_SPHCR|nr:cytochrome c oxidase subunit 3 [Sphingobium chlorophenolicum]AEG51017.1 cytochrome c oxidase subunit III [Sphingobium chlorophenolicum L-1]
MNRALRIAGDLSHLPDSGSGPHSIAWWGNIGFMAIEGFAFLLAGGCYLYLMLASPVWPPSHAAPPDLFWGALFTCVLLLSELPNRWLIRKAKEKDRRSVRIGVVVMTLIGLALFGPRVAEFDHLNIRWDQNAYGSVLWMLLLHSTHLLTDWFDTLVLAVLLHSHEVGDRQLADVRDNALYWRFVELSWLPIYALVYWAPRLA